MGEFLRVRCPAMPGEREPRRALQMGSPLRSLAVALLVAWVAAVPGPVRAADPVLAPDPDLAVGEAAQDVIIPARPVPVEFDGRVLFYVRARVGDRTAEERAGAIVGRLEEIADAREPVGPVLVKEGHHSDIFAGNRFIVSITDAEAGSHENRAFFAGAVARRIQEALARYRTERTPDAIQRAGWRALAFTGALAVLLALVAFVRRKFGPRLTRAAESLLARMRVQRFELIDPATQKQLVRWTGWVARWTVILIAVVAWADAVASLFPWTRAHAARALHFTSGAVVGVFSGVIGFLPNLVYILLFLLLGWGAQAVNQMFFRAVQAGAVQLPGFFPDWSRTTSLLVSVFIFALVAVAIYPYLPGSGSSAFQAIGLLLGAMISLGSGSAVANAISGLVLTYMRPFTLGDFVKIADTTGTVTHQSLLAVRILTIRNEHVTIPASMVLSNQILNYSAQARQSGVAIRTGVTIGYETPWRKVHELLLAAAGKTEGVLALPQPWVIQAELSDFYVRYELDAYVDAPARQHFILSEMNQNVQDVFFAAGVEILSPHYAQLRDGNRPAIPPEHLPEGATGHAFQVALRGEDRRG
jgi:small-conductance mechanosensitive channel